MIEQNSIIKSMNDLVDGATLSHLAVETRDIYYLTTVNKDEFLKTDIDGETPLHYASINDDLEICKILISRNPTIINIKDIENKTAYDWILEYNLEYNSHNDILKELLSHTNFI